ncbi:MAG: Tim44 domain-containing protein [Rubrivivax sp.]|nr:Tim44 domain-containing protein [Rubrivivax sp.]
MKLALFAALGLAVATALTPLDADAKRLGGGKSTGMQREMPARTAPDAPAGKPAGPAQQGTPAQQAAPAAAPNAAGAQAAAPKRNWMGPLAGLAAGLGLAALMSHLGLGEAFGSFLLIALLAIVAVVVIRMIMRRRQQPQPAGMAYTGSPAAGAQVAWPAPAPAGAPAAAAQVSAEPAPGPVTEASAPAAVAAAPAAKAFVPAAFDSEGFARTAKMIFIRLQAANDARDLDDLRAFTTPEMFAELSMDIQERSGEVQHTEVLTVESEVLDVADEGSRQVVSVRFRGQVLEQAGATPVAVDEVWHLVKPADGSRNWAIAGIEQWQGSAAAH